MPVLDSVTGGSTVVFTGWGAKVMVDADSAAAAVPAVVVPVPVSDTVCVLGVAESLIVSVATRVPVALGVNVTLIVQLAPAARALGSVPQVFVCAKLVEFVPLIAKLLTVIDAVPTFESVTGCAALVVPVVWLANVSVVADSLATGPAAVAPVPVSDTICVLGVAVSVRVSVALNAPAALGVNLTLTVQLAPTASDAGKVPQVFVCAKLVEFAPPIAMPLTVIALAPVLNRTTFCVALVVPISWLANVRLVVDSVAAGPVALGVVDPGLVPLNCVVVWQPLQSLPVL
jgi:hypothetical protein